MQRMHAEIHGGETDPGSPPLVLIHGAGGSRLHWPPGIRRLPGRRVLAVDLPGHGDSPGPGAASVDVYAGVVQEWLEANGLERAVVAGHSMGGAIALRLALRAPESLAGLVLVGSGGRLRVAPAILEASGRPSTFPQAVDTIIEWAFSETADTRLVELARARMLDVDPAVLHDDFAACDAFDVLDQLARIELPTLVICGDQDRLTPPKYSRALAERIRAARLAMIPGAGHMVMLEEPQATAGALTGFLTQLTTPG